jgi:hypothetical protein
VTDKQEQEGKSSCIELAGLWHLVLWVVAALESSIISQCNVIRSENCANQCADFIVE